MRYRVLFCLLLHYTVECLSWFLMEDGVVTCCLLLSCLVECSDFMSYKTLYRGLHHLPSKTIFSFQKSDLFCNVLFRHASLNIAMICDGLYAWSFIGSGWDSTIMSCSMLSCIDHCCTVQLLVISQSQPTKVAFVFCFVLLCTAVCRSVMKVIVLSWSLSQAPWSICRIVLSSFVLVHDV